MLFKEYWIHCATSSKQGLLNAPGKVGKSQRCTFKKHYACYEEDEVRGLNNTWKQSQGTSVKILVSNFEAGRTWRYSEVIYIFPPSHAEKTV